ncbi:MAG TPA: biotin/lipoyl-containing protein, partial [candidate division Zixibacteria bacterium]|nr:biotin/lipoyl-containing protein [candidate division Zixibacteria bacterium]
MPTEVVMPKLGLNMVEGTIVQWLKQEGDSVKQGELLFVVETDKITTESEAQVEGILAKILIAAGELVPVSTPVALIVAEDEVLSNADEFVPSQAILPASAPQGMKPVIREAPTSPPGKILASPVAKRLAKEHGLELSQIPGTGRFKSISRMDIER